MICMLLELSDLLAFALVCKAYVQPVKLLLFNKLVLKRMAAFIAKKFINWETEELDILEYNYNKVVAVLASAKAGAIKSLSISASACRMVNIRIITAPSPLSE